MPGWINYIACVLLFAFGRLSANGQSESFTAGKDSLYGIDTIIISTDHYDERAIHDIDSICKKHEDILQKMPVPVFIRPEGGKSTYIGNDTYRVDYDSINTLVSIRHYKDKPGSDTLGDVIREIYHYGSGFDLYFRAKYSNYKTGELLMLVQTELYTINTNITYFSGNKAIKMESHTMTKYNEEKTGPHSHLYAYYKSKYLLSAFIISSCKINFISISGSHEDISLDQCGDLVLMTRIDQKKFSRRATRKADRFWTRQK